MSKLTKDEAEKQYSIRFNEWAEADREYERIGKQYISFGPVVAGQPMRMPEKILNEEGFNNLDEVSKELEKCKKALDKATKDLYDAYGK